ncbi:PTS glucose transporter subunit IIA [Heyndrickxia sporothermodurans]|uniref:PTS glucose transporter subunit IIA n=1 Tax=Heyndrickxia sporothermodurans TaxID=46224 RepID=A0AB37HPJ6_9BACI|nr:PTS glucose transporter subunit IIA [Heyndrickxia sporothermodurans]MBL5767974.1 PTS glucose transporter subunit IIA [Heyndrickxia sporothermodurans]MBL5771531.1 PTS glucose transporter subunit IIA [Heyndrickxia sporothermodurans]MBL5775232.1 PTS glucose transporter subunit IIA [Heyndrickxia sporothermodurans]MBL5785834.1 PTS glucose transporter subunit IIA [Heyndrickxia sporothermodurans]MBL5789342.1 PTS glucose transporter subunit IIA [Heyndrickxia sporothermodurans]
MFKSLFKKENKSITITAPFNGKAVSIEEVPDQVFSEKMMGDGMAIIPSDGSLVSPIDGEVVDVFPTKHAITLRSKEGAEILIHMGLETVNLKGEGFDIGITGGDKIRKGDSLAKFDIEKVKELGYQVITPIVLLNGDDFDIQQRMSNEKTVNHKDVIMEIRKKS